MHLRPTARLLIRKSCDLAAVEANRSRKRIEACRSQKGEAPSETEADNSGRTRRAEFEHCAFNDG